MSQTYRDAARSGGRPDSQFIWAFNRTGAARTKGYVAVVNDNGTNASYDDLDGSDTDQDKNVIIMTATDIECRAVVLAQPNAAANEWCKWQIKGRCQAMVGSQADGTISIPKNAPLTQSSHVTDGSAVNAGALTARQKTGTGSMDGVTASSVLTFGRTMEAVTSAAAALTWIRLNGDGDLGNGA